MRYVHLTTRTNDTLNMRDSTPHLLWLTETYFPNWGGMAQSCDRIVQGLRARDIRVDLVHFTPRTQGWTWQRKFNGRYLACPIDHDPPHNLNRLWNLLTTDTELSTLTHVVAFGGYFPLLAAPIPRAKWTMASQDG